MQRRDFLKNSVLTAGVAMTAMPIVANAAGNKISVKRAYKAITGGKKVRKSSDKLNFTAPEIAENGKVVPIKVQAPGIDASKVKSLHVLAEKNANARIADVFFTKHNKEIFFNTRMKMAESQDLTALLVMKNGDVLEKIVNVKITIGGCG